jgi:hypothetical protein
MFVKQLDALVRPYCRQIKPNVRKNLDLRHVELIPAWPGNDPIGW